MTSGFNITELRQREYGTLTRAQQVAIDDADDAEHQEHADSLFQCPSARERIRMGKAVGNEMLCWSDAIARVNLWQAVAESQNMGENGSKTILSLFDATGNWSLVPALGEGRLQRDSAGHPERGGHQRNEH